MLQKVSHATARRLPAIAGAGRRHQSSKTAHFIAQEVKYSANNYHPMPVVFSSGSGATVTDPDGTTYLDFLSAYSAVNQGHCNPTIVNAMIKQAQNLTLSSRAFHHDQFAAYLKRMNEEFGYDKLLPMNTGAEAVETALKLARKWGYLVKKIPQNKAIILAAEGNFHGRTIGIISMSTDPEAREDFGPYLPRVGPVCPHSGLKIRYNNIDDLEAALNRHGPEVAAFLVEPIQGEAGIFVPDDDYLTRCAALCKKHNVLLICDEVQTGLARTGKMLCHYYEDVRPDMVILGKALSGGVYPVSAVLADNVVMDCIKPGQHGSTFGGNPIACAVAVASLDVIKNEKLEERADKLGKIFRAGVEGMKSPFVQEVRGRGLLNAIVVDQSKSKKGRTAWQLCLLLKANGLLAKPTGLSISSSIFELIARRIRFSPPLVLREDDLQKALQIIEKCLREFDTIEEIPGDDHHH